MTAPPDISEFKELSHPTTGLCKVGRALEGLDAESRAQLEAAITAPTSEITNAAVLKWLERRDVDSVSSPSLTAHRKGRCSCVRG